jgi:T5SS/PEP-CTERM-associated repeat protein
VKKYIVKLLGCFLLMAGSAWGYPNPIENQSAVVVTNAWDLEYVTLYVGQTTAGNSLTIEQGGSVTSGYGVIGADTTASGNSVVIQGTNSSWISYDGIALGGQGSDNTLSVLDQATVSMGDLTFGESAGATNNTFEVDHAIATITANLLMNGSANRLLVSNGGKVITSSSQLLFTSDNNTVTISGAGSVLTNSNEHGNFELGGYKNLGGVYDVTGNRLLISDGGTLTGFDSIAVGGTSGSSSNLLQLSGANTSVQLGQIYMRGLSNRVDVVDGAQLSLGYSFGFFESCGGLLSISDTGSVCTINGNLESYGSTETQISVTNGGLLQISSIAPSDSSSLTLDILSGGTVETAGNLTFTSDNNTLQISGAGSVLTNSSEWAWLYLGEGENPVSGNRILISAGGTLAGFQELGILGNGENSSNLIQLNGATTSVQLDNIGISGLSNRVEVVDGAQLSLGDSFGFLGSCGGLLSISDTGSVCTINGNLESYGSTGTQISVTNSGLLQIGSLNDESSLGSLTLDILSGGTVETRDNLTFASDNNTIQISGAGSALTSTSYARFEIGGYDYWGDPYDAIGNRLLISDGGTLTGFGSISIVGTPGSSNNLLQASGANTDIYVSSIELSGNENRIEVDQGGRIRTGSMVINQQAMLAVRDGVFDTQDLSMAADGSIQIELSAERYSSPSLFIHSSAWLEGTLSAVTAPGLDLIEGDRFYLIGWGGVPKGTFATLDLPELSFGLDWDTSMLYTNGSILVTAGGDSDEDGMDDAWEVQYFKGDADPEDDPDHDGQSNLTEFIAGMDPTDPNSLFKVTETASSPDGFVIRWQSVSNRTYGIYWTGVLTNSLQPLQTGIDYPQNSYTDVLHQAESAGFYKIEVQLK